MDDQMIQAQINQTALRVHPDVQQVFDKHFSLEYPYTKYLLAQLQIVTPRKSHFVKRDDGGFLEVEEAPLPAHEMQRQFTENVYRKAIKFESDQIEVIALSIKFAEEKIAKIGKKDARLLIGTLLVCWLYAWKEMGLVLSTASILNLFMCLPVSLVIYKLVLRQEYFSVIHMASILILVSNGMYSLLIWHHQKSVRPILAVSAASFVAYTSSLTKKIMPLKDFGVFALVLVPVIATCVSVFQPILYYLTREKEEIHYFPPARQDKSTQTPTRAKWISFIHKWRIVITCNFSKISV